MVRVSVETATAERELKTLVLLVEEVTKRASENLGLFSKGKLSLASGGRDGNAGE